MSEEPKKEDQKERRYPFMTPEMERYLTEYTPRYDKIFPNKKRG